MSTGMYIALYVAVIFAAAVLINKVKVMDAVSKQVVKVFRTEKAFGQAKFLLFMMIGLAFWIFLMAIVLHAEDALVVLVLIVHMYFVTSMRYPEENIGRN